MNIVMNWLCVQVVVLQGLMLVEHFKLCLSIVIQSTHFTVTAFHHSDPTVTAALRALTSYINIKRPVPLL